MQQVCNNFIADPTDSNFGFQIKCKNCQFTRKQHIQNNNAKTNPEVNDQKIVASNSKVQGEFTTIMKNALQNQKRQDTMYGSQNQQKATPDTIPNDQNAFKKTISLNSKPEEIDQSDQLQNDQMKLERQNLQIYNSDKAQTNQNQKVQEFKSLSEDQNQKGLQQNPFIQKDQSPNQFSEQIQNQKQKQNELEELSPKKIQSNPFSKQDSNPQKQEQQQNKQIPKTNDSAEQQPKKLSSNPFIQKNLEKVEQTNIQTNLVEDQKPKKLSSNPFIQQDSSSPQKVYQKPLNNQVITIKPSVQIIKEQQQKDQEQKDQSIQKEIQKPSNNLNLPQTNQNTNQLQSPQSVKERAKQNIQIFGFGAPPPIRLTQDPYQEKPQEQYLLDRPILQDKKHIRTQKDFQDFQN